MGMRKSGKDMALWMSADDTAVPVLADLIDFPTGISWSSRANISNTTAAGDSGAQKAGGIPDASLRLTGRLDTTAPTNRLLEAHNDQEPRQFKFLFDSGTEIGPEFLAIVSEYGQSAQHTSPWDISVQLEIIGLVTEDRTP